MEGKGNWVEEGWINGRAIYPQSHNRSSNKREDGRKGSWVEEEQTNGSDICPQCHNHSEEPLP